MQSDITIEFSNEFCVGKIYELHSLNKTSRLIFNDSNENFETKVGVIAILNNGQMFKNKTVSIVSEKPSPFLTVLKSIVSSSALTVYENDAPIRDNIIVPDRLNETMCLQATGPERCTGRVLETKEITQDPQAIFDEVVAIVRTKKLKLPNFKRSEPFAVKRQINWLRSILSRNHKTLPDKTALIIKSHLSNIDLPSLQCP